MTSWVEDETVYMANMLRTRNHIVQDLFQSPTEIRMKKFLILFAIYPAAILSISGPRMLEEGCWWVPISWLVRNNNEDEQEELDASAQQLALRMDEV